MKFIQSLALVAAAAASMGATAAPVNVNTASADELAAALNGIGLSKAQAIVDYRTQHGPFSSVEELAQIKGIGGKTLERNRSDILLGDGGASSSAK